MRKKTKLSSKPSILHKAAKSIRHFPGLERCEFFWKMLRKPFYFFLRLGLGREGMPIKVGKFTTVCIPPEYIGAGA